MLRRTSKVVSLHDGRDADEGVLAELGYDQELKRSWGLIHNFGVSFSIIVTPPGASRVFASLR